jgi:hypothetical protein
MAEIIRRQEHSIIPVGVLKVSLTKPQLKSLQCFWHSFLGFHMHPISVRSGSIYTLFGTAPLFKVKSGSLNDIAVAGHASLETRIEMPPSTRQ